MNQNLLFILISIFLYTACLFHFPSSQPTAMLPTCAKLHAGAAKPLQLILQRTDQSIWLIPLPADGNPSLIDACRRQLTESMTGKNDIVNWSLSPDQQWLASIQLKGWRTPGDDPGRAFLLNIETGEKRLLVDKLLPDDYDWMQGPWDTDRALLESEPLWSRDSRHVILIAAPAGQTGLYRYDLSTEALTLLAQSQQNIAWPQWSPDEKYLLYNDITAFGTGAGPTGGALWSVRSDGREAPRRLSQTDEQYERVNRWVDDTHVTTYKIAFSRPAWDWGIIDLQNGSRLSAPPNDPSALPCWHYAPDTRELAIKLQLLADEQRECNATLSPDGQFATANLIGSIEESSKFLLLDLQKGTVITLAESPNVAAFTPMWSPTGDMLLWLAPTTEATEAQTNYALWAIHVEQKQPFQIAEQIELWRKWYWIRNK